MFIPGSLVPCVGAITGSTTTMQIPIVARGLVSLMGRKIGAFFAPKITKNLISEGRLCTNYSFRIKKQGTEIILTDLTSSGSSNTAVFSIEGGTGLYRIPSYLLMWLPQGVTTLLTEIVQPSSKVVLWHRRIPVSIQKLRYMSRQSEYGSRGLRIDVSESEWNRSKCLECMEVTMHEVVSHREIDHRKNIGE